MALVVAGLAVSLSRGDPVASAGAAAVAAGYLVMLLAHAWYAWRVMLWLDGGEAHAIPPRHGDGARRGGGLRGSADGGFRVMSHTPAEPRRARACAGPSRGGWVEHVIHEDVGCAPSYFCPDCAAEDYTLAEFGALAGLFEKSGE